MQYTQYFTNQMICISNSTPLAVSMLSTQGRGQCRRLGGLSPPMKKIEPSKIFNLSPPKLSATTALRGWLYSLNCRHITKPDHII